MAKKKVKVAAPESVEKPAMQEKKTVVRSLVIPPWLSSHWIQAFIVSVIAFVFYVKSLVSYT